MSLDVLAIDLGKRTFHIYGIDTDGVILSRKVRQAKLAAVVDALAPTAIARSGRGLKLTRFRGHQTVCVRGVHDGQDKTSVCAGVSSPDGGIGASRALAGGAGGGV
jgi:hypothetical protein